MSPPRVEAIDHTADVGLRVWAATSAEAFAAVAEAMFDIMVEREGIEDAHRWQVAVDADDWEDLLIAWLEELLYLYETERMVLHSCHVREIGPSHLDAELAGDYLNPERHPTRVQIKAVTYHQLRAEETAEGFEIQVIFDI
jgi:SHS2 domain-containing protein